jgi:hypothetical protein
MLLRARRLYHQRGQWLRVVARDNPRAQWVGIRSERNPDVIYFATRTSCTCPWWRTRGLGAPRIGFAGVHEPCKHVVAVRMLWEEQEEDYAPLAPVIAIR